MIIKTHGVILRAIKYSETSIITDIYTQHKGLRTYIISGVRKKGSKVPAGLLQVMSLVDLVVYFREEKQMNRIREIKAAHIYRQLPFDVFRSAVGMFIIELTRKNIHESEENQNLFAYLFQTLVHLDSSDKAINNIHIAYMIGLTSFLGFQPNPNNHGENTFLDLQSGIFTDEEPSHKYYLNADLTGFFLQLLINPLESSHKVKMSKIDRRALLNSLISFYKLHVEAFSDLNTHTILEKILDS